MVNHSDLRWRLMLVWIRLNYPHQDIAHAFGLAAIPAAAIADAGLVAA